MADVDGPIVVIGTGISGLAVAFELLQHQRPVCLIGPRSFDGAASPAAGAMIDTFGEIAQMKHRVERVQLEARLWAQRYYKDWLAQLADESGHSIFQINGLFVVANSGGDHDAEKLALMRAEMERHREPYENPPPSTIPGIRANVQFRPYDALFMPTALTVDSNQLLSALHAAIGRDARCQWLVETVAQVEPAARGFRVVTDSGKRLVAAEVVVAAGAFSKRVLGEQLWREAQLPPLYYGRGASCLVDAGEPLPFGVRTPNRALACGIHLVPRAGGKVYLGATNLFGTESDRACRGATVGELHTLLGVISNQLNTGLRNVAIESVSWGLRPITAYDHPIAGRTALEGLSVVTGAHRTGIHLAPYLAKVVVAELLGTPSEFEGNPFSPLTASELVPESKDFALGIRSLLATALYPDGSMPYGRAREVEVFIESLLRLALDQDRHCELGERLRQISDEIAIDEQRMIRMFHEVLQQRLPEGGPYVL